jgi:type IV pilus assembly protein PilM
MVGWVSRTRNGPIGIDLGSRSVKLVQFTADQSRLVDAARWELPSSFETAGDAARGEQLAQAIRRAREGGKFRGREAVLCLGASDLVVQNVRVPKLSGAELDRTLRQEAESRLPFPAADAEIRFLQAADVRHGETVKREVVVMACRRQSVESLVELVNRAGLRTVAIDVEPTALLRCYINQYRREEDRDRRSMFVHFGSGSTVAVIAKGAEVLFIKYVDVLGRNLDEAVARHLNMPLSEAILLRRNNGDRRADQQDPLIASGIAEATRPVIDRLAQELSMCIRYHSVTFRGQPLAQLLVSGGEATPGLVEALSSRLDVKCELGDPLRDYETKVPGGRIGQWDIATGLALRSTN